MLGEFFFFCSSFLAIASSLTQGVIDPALQGLHLPTNIIRCKASTCRTLLFFSFAFLPFASLRMRFTFLFFLSLLATCLAMSLGRMSAFLVSLPWDGPCKGFGSCCGLCLCWDGLCKGFGSCCGLWLCWAGAACLGSCWAGLCAAFGSWL